MNTDPGWDKIVDAIDVRFGIDRHGRRQEPLPDNQELTQTITFIEFQKGGQTYRMERIARPAVTDRKSIYHKAAGSGVRFENVYDPDATTFRTQLLKQAGDDWEEVDPTELAL